MTQLKSPQEYICINCDYKTINKKDYTNHLSTRKHRKFHDSTDKFPLLQGSKYSCEKCDYYTCSLKDYNKHIKTTKHINNIRNSTITNQIINNPVYEQNVDEKNNIELSNEFVLELIKQSKELQTAVLEQNQKMMEITKTANTMYMNNSNNTTNNQFNVNLFLNETCKDALNLSDFVNSVQLQLEDLETTARLGYVDGISRIMIKALNDMDIEKRPIHCSDIKRETVYVKEQNIWEKENSEKRRLKQAVNYIAKQNLSQIQHWKEENPNWDNNREDSDALTKLYTVALGGATENESDKFMSRIIKNVIQEVTIDKNGK